MSHYNSPGGLHVHGRGLNARAGNPLANIGTTPVQGSSPPPFGPPSPNASAQSSSPFMSSSPVVSRFNQGNFQNAMSPVALAPSSGYPNTFKVIQRPLASRVPAHGVAAFQHSIHPTAVQASHSVGHAQAAKNSAAAAAAQQQQQQAVVAAVQAQFPSTMNMNRSSSPSLAGGSPTSSKLKSKDWYGTFPKLGGNNQRVGSAGSSSPMADTSSPVRASPVTTSQGRSPEPLLMGAPSTLHPRSPKDRALSAKVIRTGTPGTPSNSTPPHSWKKKSHSAARRNSEQGLSIDSEMGGLSSHMGDMDLTDDPAAPNSGYSSDASAISVESHVSSFPAENQPYSRLFFPQAIAGGNIVSHVVMDPTTGLPFPQEIGDEEELEAVTVDTQNNRPPASPMQLRAGALPPTGSYAKGNSPVALRSGTNSVRSGSRIEMSSADHSALTSPFMDATKSTTLFHPMSPIPSIDSIVYQADHNSLNIAPLSAAEKEHGAGAPTVVVAHPQPLPITTVPALNLPRSVANGLVNPAVTSPRSPNSQGTEPLTMPSTYRQLSDQSLGSAFSSARSYSQISNMGVTSGTMMHSTSTTSISMSDSMDLSDSSAASSAQASQR